VESFRDSFPDHPTGPDLRGVERFLHGLPVEINRAYMRASCRFNNAHRIMLVSLTDSEQMFFWPVDADPLLRIVHFFDAGMILAGHPGGRGSEEMLPFMDDDDEFRRVGCIRVLGSLGERRAIPWLIEILDDYEPDAVVFGSRFLAFVNDLPISLSMETNPALDALRKLTGQNLGRNKAAWRAWWEANKEELLQSATPFPIKSSL